MLVDSDRAVYSAAECAAALAAFEGDGLVEDPLAALGDDEEYAATLAALGGDGMLADTSVDEYEAVLAALGHDEEFAAALSAKRGKLTSRTRRFGLRIPR